MKKILPLLLLLILVDGWLPHGCRQEVRANHDGYVDVHGYTFRGGYWYYPGYSVGYGKRWTAPCYTCGRYAAGYYTYYPAYYPPAPTTNNINVTVERPQYSADWKVEGIKYLEKLNDLEAFEVFYSNIASQRKSLGSSSYGSIIGANASTPYGYSTQQTTLSQRAYGDGDENQALILSSQAFAQNVGRMIDGGTQLAGLQGDIHDKRFAQFQLNRLERDKLVARLQSIGPSGKAIEGVVKSVTHGPTVIQNQATVTTTRPVGPGPQPPPLPMPPAPVDRTEQLEDVMANKCASCHSGAKLSGGVDLSLYLKFDANSKARVYRAVNRQNQDPAKNMPPDGHPQLTAEERSLFPQQ